MKVIDFGSGNSSLVRMNWRDGNPGGMRFISQPFFQNILGGDDNKEVHCYDSVAIIREENGQHLGDKVKILLHSSKRTLPINVDMVCAFNPNPRVVFGTQDKYGSNSPEYDKYISQLVFVIKTRLRVGGILAVQFDKSMIPPIQPCDGAVLFLRKASSGNPQFSMKGIRHIYGGGNAGVIQLFESRVSYDFSSLHIFQKVNKS